MMKAKLRTLISLFEKDFAKNVCNSEKERFEIKSHTFTKNFSFPVLQKNCRSFGILYLHGLQFPVVTFFSKEQYTTLSFGFGIELFVNNIILQL